MSSQTKSTLKLIAIVLVILMILMHLGVIAIPFLVSYKFWILIGAFVLLLLAS